MRRCLVQEAFWVLCRFGPANLVLPRVNNKRELKLVAGLNGKSSAFRNEVKLAGLC